MGCLYQIVFPNGKSYIGITTKTAEKRLAVHSYRRNHADYAICNALRKYDCSATVIKTLVIANDWPYLCELERRAINAFNTKSPNGYNMTDGGESPTGLSAESLARIGAAAKGNTYNVGKKRTAETRAKMSKSGKEKPPMSAETKIKIGVASRGNKYSLGRKQCDEEIMKRVCMIRGKAKGKSGIAGVSFDAQTGKWRATLTLKYKTIHLGRFEKIEDATAARSAGEKIYYEY